MASQARPDLSAMGTTNARPVNFGPGGQNPESPASPGGGQEVFDDFPELTAIGLEALQDHCNEWLKTSIARQSRIKTVAIGVDSSQEVSHFRSQN